MKSYKPLNSERYKGFLIKFKKDKDTGIVSGKTFRWSNNIIEEGKTKKEVLSKITQILNQQYI